MKRDGNYIRNVREKETKLFKYLILLNKFNFKYKLLILLHNLIKINFYLFRNFFYFPFFLIKSIT